MRDRDEGGDDGVVGERDWEEEAVYARGPGIGRGGVFGEMIESVRGVRRVEKGEASLEGVPDVGKRGGGKKGRGSR